ncbi:MAG: AraC family transcriptional regulator [Pseudomonadales bacterium]|nr:AraC family transcriptional regulator [Pseudomonadales bacterium]
MPAPTVAFELFDAIFQYLQSQGYPEEILCEHLKIKSKTDVEIEGRIPLSLYEKAFVAAEKITGDVAIGMRMGSKMYPNSTGIFYFISVAGENLKQIMEAIRKYFPIAYDFLHLDMESDASGLHIVFKYENYRPQRHVIEHLFAHWYTVANELSFDVNNVPRTLFFSHSNACDEETVNQVFFNVPVLFNQDCDRFDLQIDSVNYHTGHSDRNLFRRTEQWATNLLIQLRSQDRIAKEVSDHVLAVLESGAPSIEDIAKKMHCSGRTLQRRLAERSLSYQMLLDSIRSELAIELLSSTELPITQIATRAGFSDDSTFHRAFKRWTGESPSRFRQFPALVTYQPRHSNLVPGC